MPPQNLLAERRDRIDQVLAVVDHQQHLPFSQAVDQTSLRIAFSCGQIKQRRQMRADQRGIGDGRQIHQADAVAILVEQLFSDAQGDGGLANAAGADQSDAASARQLRNQVIDQGLATNHPRTTQRQVVPGRGDRRRCFDAVEHERCDKAVAALRHGDDVALAVLPVAKRFAQRCHVHAQIDVFNDTVWPDPGHQLLFAHHFTGMGQQNQEDVHRPPSQAQRLLAFK